MAITDLTGTTWLINSSITEPSSTIIAEINFTSNSETFAKIRIYDGLESGTEQLIGYSDIDSAPTFVYEYGWTNEAYRTIAITGGTDATNSTLIAWLESNAENVTPVAPDLVVTYAGDEIATMSDSGTKTLKTQGKYCEDDITISYTKSGGGGGGGSTVTITIQDSMGLITDVFYPTSATWSGFDLDPNTGIPKGTLVINENDMFVIAKTTSNALHTSGVTASRFIQTGSRIAPYIFLAYSGTTDGTISA